MWSQSSKTVICLSYIALSSYDFKTDWQMRTDIDVEIAFSRLLSLSVS